MKMKDAFGLPDMRKKLLALGKVLPEGADGVDAVLVLSKSEDMYPSKQGSFKYTCRKPMTVE